MNKRLNTILFLLVASVFNVVVTLAVLVLGTAAVFRLLPKAMASSSFGIIAILTVFLVSLAASALIYRGVLSLIRKKVDMDKYFEPLFGNNRSRRFR